MKRVYIMRGVPGSGKSYYARKMAQSGELKQVTVCSADYFFENWDRPYEFDPARLPEAHAACMSAFLQALFEGHDTVVVDNTNIKRWMYEPYEKAARLAGYDVRIVEVMPKTLTRLAGCAKRNEHNVPAEVVARMAMDFEPDGRKEMVWELVPEFSPDSGKPASMVISKGAKEDESR